MPKYVLSSGDILLVSSSGSPHLVGRAAYFENLNTDKYLFSNFLIRIKASEKIIPLYLYYFFKSEDYNNFLKRLQETTSGLRNLSKSNLVSISLTIPEKLREQQKIASILSKVDELTQKTDRIIEQTQRLKKGLMQRLLTKGIEHTEFKKTELGQIPEGWRTVKLKDVVSSYKNGIYKKSSFYGRGVLNIRMFNIQDGKINTRETPLLDVSAQELLDYGLIPDDILINRVNSYELVGKAGILSNDIGSAVFDSMIIRVRVNELCIPHFLNYYLNSKIYFRQIEGKIKHAIGQSSLNQDDLNSLLIGLPTKGEQTKIVSILSILDDKTENLVMTNQKNKNLKKALMQKVLTGKIRVKV